MSNGDAEKLFFLVLNFSDFVHIKYQIKTVTHNLTLTKPLNRPIDHVLDVKDRKRLKLAHQNLKILVC